MSLNKKYFYLKLKDNFFDREEIRVIQGLENGDTYVCIILEMYLRSLKRNGILMMSERIPYSIRTLSSVLKRRQDEIKYAVDLFKEFGLIEILNSGAIFMADIQDFIGESSTEADRKRIYRTKIEAEKKESLKHLENGTNVQTNVQANDVNPDEIVQKRQMSDKCPDFSPPELELELKTELELELKERDAREKNSHADAQKNLPDGNNVTNTLPEGYRDVTKKNNNVAQSIESRDKNTDTIEFTDVNSLSGNPDDTNPKSYPYAEIVNYLNQKTGSNYQSTCKKTRELIRARFADGHDVDAFKRAVDNQVALWWHDFKFRQYLRPDTLFGPKMDSYANANVTPEQIAVAQGKVGVAIARGMEEGTFNIKDMF